MVEGGDLMNGTSALIRRSMRHSPSLGPVRTLRRPSMNQEVGSHQTPNMLNFDLELTNLERCEK